MERSKGCAAMDLDQKDRGYGNREEEKMVPAQQCAAANLPSVPRVPFLTEKQGEVLFDFARLKRKQSMSGHNLVGSWVNLYFIPIIECIP